MMRSKFLYLIALSAMIFMTSPANAGDSGVYYTPEVDGQGLNFTRFNNLTQFFFYTYEPHSTCWNLNIPELGLVTHDNCHEQRYFMSSGDVMIDEDTIEGWLYITVGLDFPFGVTDPTDPFIHTVGAPLAVGQYRMERFGDGWRLSIVRWGEVLEPDDPIFTGTIDFTTRILAATD
jgi:hypothetical protein